MICILSLKTLICSRTCAISLQEYSNRSNDQVRLLPLSSGQNIVFQNLSCRLTWSFLIGNGVVEVCYIYPLVVLWSMKNWIKKCCIQLLLAFLMLFMFFRRTSWLLCNSQFFVLTVCITAPCQNSQKLNFQKRNEFKKRPSSIKCKPGCKQFACHDSIFLKVHGLQLCSNVVCYVSTL